MSPHYLVDCRTHSSDGMCVVFLQTLVALKRRTVLCGTGGYEKKLVSGYVVRQLEYQASSVTASVQNDHRLHGYMLPVFCATDKSHCPPRFAEIQPMSHQAATATRAYRGLEVGIHVSASCHRCSKSTGFRSRLLAGHARTGGVSHSAEARLSHECDVLVHCLGGRQTRPQQCSDRWQQLLRWQHVSIIQSK